jgi:hypothetical protein
VGHRWSGTERCKSKCKGRNLCECLSVYHKSHMVYCGLRFVVTLAVSNMGRPSSDCVNALKHKTFLHYKDYPFIDVQGNKSLISSLLCYAL